MSVRNVLSSLVALFLVACSGSSGDGGGGSFGMGGEGQITIEVTDKPFDHSIVEEAVVRVDKVRVHVEIENDMSGGDDGEWVTVYEGQPIEFDLLDLTNGVTRTLVAFADLRAGTVRQMRLHVASGYLLLINGNLYTTDDGSLQLTSQDKSGFKVFIDPPLVVADGFSYQMLLDFDLTKTFKPVPGNDPLNANKYKFHPVIRACNLSETGELRGTVSREDDQGDLVPAAGAIVFVLPEGFESPDDAVASTKSNADGKFVVLGLEPDVYDVLAVSEELQGFALSKKVVAGGVTAVEIVIE